MVSWNKIEMVQKMQDYIKEKVFQRDFKLEKMYKYIGYSARHCNRIFKELMGKTLEEYVKAITISNSSQELLKNDKKIIEIAMDSNFETHEGYTRAFQQTFGISPNKYRKNPKPIPLFIQYPVKSYYSYLYKKEDMFMETALCMIHVVERPKRKLVFLRSKQAKDYFSYCEEMGCEWEGLFNSIVERMGTAAILELPSFLCKEGFSNVAAGIELPITYQGEVLKDCEMVELEPCKMLFFESEPFEKEEDFFPAIETVFRAVEKYEPEKYGYYYADGLAPRFNYGGEIGDTAKYAIPIKNK